MKFYTHVGRHKGKIIHIGYENGKKFIHQEPFSPHLGIPTTEETGYKSLDGKNIQKVEFDNLWDLHQYKKEYEDVFDFYNDIDPIYQFLVETYPNDIEYETSHLQIMFLDVECFDPKVPDEDQQFTDPEDATAPINLIQCKLSKTGKIYIFGMEDFDINSIDPDLEITDKVHFFKAKTEKELITAFLKFFRHVKPDVITGWNIKGYDIPYMINRLPQVFDYDVSSQFAIYGSCKTSARWFEGMKVFRSYVPGVALLDLMEIYKMIAKPLHSYSLDAVSEHELKKKKVDYTTQYGTMFRCYRENYQKFVEYGIYDVELPYLLEKKLGYLNTHILLGYIFKCNFEDTLRQTAAWDQIIFDYLTKENIFIPPRAGGDREHFVGAYVKEPVPGIYKWIASFDVNSMYPSAVMQFNISPETVIGRVDQVNREHPDKKYLDPEYHNTEDYILAANGVAFRKDIEGIGSKIMKDMYAKRKECKAKLIEYNKKAQIAEEAGDKLETLKYKALASEYKGQDHSRKVALNSYFGACGNEWFRYYDIRLAEAITMCGQFALITVGKHVEEYLRREFEKPNANFWVYSDTDSCYFTFEEIIDDILYETKAKDPIKAIDAFCEDVIQKQIDKAFESISKKMNCNETYLAMKRELIGEYGLFKAKKHYTILVNDDEGTIYTEPKLVSKGIELVQSSTPAAIKPMMKKAIIQMMKDPKGLVEYLDEVEKDFRELHPHEIAFSQSANNLGKYRDEQKIFGKGCPIGVRAALIHNACVEQGKIKSDGLIPDQGKIKFIYMLKPNPYFNSNVVGYLNKFPYEKRYVDYSTQYEKTFSKVIEGLAKAVGINISKQLSLEDLL